MQQITHPLIRRHVAKNSFFSMLLHKYATNVEMPGHLHTLNLSSRKNSFLVHSTSSSCCFHTTRHVRDDSSKSSSNSSSSQLFDQSPHIKKQIRKIYKFTHPDLFINEHFKKVNSQSLSTFQNFIDEYKGYLKNDSSSSNNQYHNNPHNRFQHYNKYELQFYVKQSEQVKKITLFGLPQNIQLSTTQQHECFVKNVEYLFSQLFNSKNSTESSSSLNPSTPPSNNSTPSNNLSSSTEHDPNSSSLHSSLEEYYQTNFRTHRTNLKDSFWFEEKYGQQQQHTSNLNPHHVIHIVNEFNKTSNLDFEILYIRRFEILSHLIRNKLCECLNAKSIRFYNYYNSIDLFEKQYETIMKFTNLLHDQYGIDTSQWGKKEMKHEIIANLKRHEDPYHWSKNSESMTWNSHSTLDDESFHDMLSNRMNHTINTSTTGSQRPTTNTNTTTTNNINTCSSSSTTNNTTNTSIKSHMYPYEISLIRRKLNQHIQIKFGSGHTGINKLGWINLNPHDSAQHWMNYLLYELNDQDIQRVLNYEHYTDMVLRMEKRVSQQQQQQPWYPNNHEHEQQHHHHHTHSSSHHQTNSSYKNHSFSSSSSYKNHSFSHSSSPQYIKYYYHPLNRHESHLAMKYIQIQQITCLNDELIHDERYLTLLSELIRIGKSEDVNNHSSSSHQHSHLFNIIVYKSEGDESLDEIQIDDQWNYIYLPLSYVNKYQIVDVANPSTSNTLNNTFNPSNNNTTTTTPSTSNTVNNTFNPLNNNTTTTTTPSTSTPPPPSNNNNNNNTTTTTTTTTTHTHLLLGIQGIHLLLNQIILKSHDHQNTNNEQQLQHDIQQMLNETRHYLNLRNLTCIHSLSLNDIYIACMKLVKFRDVLYPYLKHRNVLIVNSNDPCMVRVRNGELNIEIPFNF